jgi:tetratricopeptide (TPR) repeat protein
VRKLPIILLGAALTASALAESTHDGLAQVNAALQAGEADKALALLSSLPPPDAASAQAHNLRCRVLFTLEHWDGAARECDIAVRLEPRNSSYHLWLGRALGEQADRASFLNAYNLAKRARSEFEQSVQLDPRNAEALADLGEFYSAAPSVVGGGMDKANSVAGQLDKVDPARAHELRAAMARENKDLATAEAELKQAIAASHHPAFQWMRLASFYRKAKRPDDMEHAVQSGLAAAEHDPHAQVALFNGASVLVKANRDPQLAEKMLNMYLSSPTGTEEGPAFTAHVWLARLKAQMGDLAGARQERSAALALANEYKPAQDLKN